ncbi:MAG: c-type cytochrome [Gammaproteobacteria bacterium]|uniref:c-type cytochrome n=1 Tax=Azohydromonas sp. TaxID=1872666 RepID=UPI002CAE656C|nr:c-type cytochrome [Azohydromonas sp.]HMM84783.1 c-type cytochrome [Azohydromonas sp.]
MKPISALLASLPAITALAGALLAPSTTLAAGAQAPKADLAKGQAVAAQVCVACHTFDGTRGAPANPIIAGQHPEYLAKQLREFKEGKRVNAIMQGFAAGLSDEDMRNVAAFYASKAAPQGAARKADLVLLGERIWRGGIAGKNVPACAGCHSPNGAGIPAEYPRLAGQHAEYTDAQLKAFRAGERANNAQMTAISANLSDREVAALADYVAGLR